MTTFLLLALFFPQDADDLIKKLGSDRLEEREAATRELRALGESARPALEKAAKSSDAEVSTRVRNILRFLDIRAQVTPGLLKAVPDAVERLSGPDPHLWTEILLEATGWKPKSRDLRHPFIVREDVEKLAAPAMTAAKTIEEKHQVISVIVQWRLKSGLPALEKALSDPDPVVRSGVLQSFRFTSPETTPLILKSLNDEDLNVRRMALALSYERKLPGFAAEARRTLEKGPPELKYICLMGLYAVEGSSFAGELATYLDKMSDEEQLNLLLDPRFAPRAAKLLDHPKTDIRQRAVGALAALGARQYLPDLVKLLDDDNDEMRRSVEYALSRFGYREHGARLVARLKAADHSERRGALMNFELIGDSRYAKDVLPMLQDPNVWVRVHAAAALSAMGESKCKDMLPLIDPADPRYAYGRADRMVIEVALKSSPADQDEVAAFLKKLESNEKAEVARNAAIALVRMGRKDREAQRQLVERHLATYTPDWMSQAVYLCEALLVANEPRLRESVEVKKRLECVDDVNALFEPCRLRVEYDWRAPLTIAVGKYTRFEIFRRIPYLNAPPGPPILDESVIRFTHHELALERWKELLRR